MPTQENLPQANAIRPRGCTCFRLRKLTRRVTQHYDSHLARAQWMTRTGYRLLLRDGFPVPH